jgi:hypothetical protein
MDGRRQTLLGSLLGGVLLLCALAGPAAAQNASQPQDTVTDEQSFDPSLTRAVPETAPVEEPTDEPIDTEDAETAPGSELPAETIEKPGWGNAADQSPRAKEEEAEDDCADDARPPNSKLLGLPSSVGGDSDDPLGTLILVIAGGALAVAAVAYRLRSRRGATAPRGSLELVATLVGILGGIAGIAVQFVPGVGVHDAPTPTATMAVRDINTRITHGEYARKTNGRMPQGEDRREVGNVIWLEVRLEGYADKRPALQYASYNTDRGQLLPGTAAQVPLPDGDAEVETHFVPIWIGYPLSERFEAGFRLLDGNRVQAVAETGRMKASRYRYACTG